MDMLGFHLKGFIGFGRALIQKQATQAGVLRRGLRPKIGGKECNRAFEISSIQK
jgi:hypothetical protein